VQLIIYSNEYPNLQLWHTTQLI